MRIYMIDKKLKRSYNERDLHETTEMFNKGYFNLVADAMYDDSNLDDVYTAMQNIGNSWITHPDVMSYAPSVEYTRSLSVGDVILKGYGINKKYYKVASAGFERLYDIDEMFD